MIVRFAENPKLLSTISYHADQNRRDTRLRERQHLQDHKTLRLREKTHQLNTAENFRAAEVVNRLTTKITISTIQAEKEKAVTAIQADTERAAIQANKEIEIAKIKANAKIEIAKIQATTEITDAIKIVQNVAVDAMKMVKDAMKKHGGSLSTGEPTVEGTFLHFLRTLL